MSSQIAKLKERLAIKESKKPDADFNTKRLLFESKYAFVLPSDLVEYFQLVDGISDKMDANLYYFYSIEEFISVKEELADWGGSPDYRNIVNTLKGCESCFVFADYMLHTFTYAIRLYHDERNINDVYVICGDKYKVIASSFSDFLELYLTDADELQSP